jgi:hypothetical protein
MVWTHFKTERGENSKEGLNMKMKKKTPKWKTEIKMGTTG